MPVEGELMTETLEDDVVVVLPDGCGETGFEVARLVGFRAGRRVDGFFDFFASEEGWRGGCEGMGGREEVTVMG